MAWHGWKWLKQGWVCAALMENSNTHQRCMEGAVFCLCLVLSPLSHSAGQVVLLLLSLLLSPSPRSCRPFAHSCWMWLCVVFSHQVVHLSAGLTSNPKGCSEKGAHDSRVVISLRQSTEKQMEVFCLMHFWLLM